MGDYTIALETCKQTLSVAPRFDARLRAASARREADARQLRWMLLASFLLLLLPASLARLTGWRWRPWPPGARGYGSIVSEARTAAETYVSVGFVSP